MKVLFLEGDDHYLLGLPFGFRELGCVVKIMTEINQETLEEVLQKFKPDLVITSGWTQMQIPSNIKLIAKLTNKYNIKTAYWATEDPLWLDSWSLPLITQLKPNYIFTISQETVLFYRNQGYNAHYLPWGINPKFHRKTSQQSCYKCDIVVVATAPVESRSYRLKCIEILLKPLLEEKKYNISIWGNGWENNQFLEELGIAIDPAYLQGVLPYKETNYVYSSSKVILGFQNNTKELTQRTYEILGARGFLIAPASEAILKTFEDGRHLVTSRSPEETLKVVDYFLKNEDERKKIAAEGYKEVRRHHTYKARAAKIIEIVSD